MSPATRTLMELFESQDHLLIDGARRLVERATGQPVALDPTSELALLVVARALAEGHAAVDLRPLSFEQLLENVFDTEGAREILAAADVVALTTALRSPSLSPLIERVDLSAHPSPAGTPFVLSEGGEDASARIVTVMVTPPPPLPSPGLPPARAGPSVNRSGRTVMVAPLPSKATEATPPSPATDGDGIATSAAETATSQPAAPLVLATMKERETSAPRATTPKSTGPAGETRRAARGGAADRRTVMGAAPSTLICSASTTARAAVAAVALNWIDTTVSRPGASDASCAQAASNPLAARGPPRRMRLVLLPVI